MSYRPTPTSPIGMLEAQGQSLWLDYIHRSMLKSGELKRLIETRGIRGVTSNPTIFEQAIAQSDAYDEAIAALARKGATAEAIYETLVVEDIQAACDLFRPIYEMSGGNDGFVSIEVSPRLAYDGDGTLVEARRLWGAVARPNVLIKIPGTEEGLPAIAAAIAEGINVNVTLLFAVSMYERVVDAYLTGLERRLAAGGAVDSIRSVASFFVSRVDTECDRRLSEAGAPPELQGRAAVANARLAWQMYLKHFEGERFRKLMGQGAAVQRPLWASTGTKNKAYSDVKYVDELIGPDTINTLPPATLEAFADHGVARRTIDEGLDQARAHLEAIERAGVKLEDVTDFLVKDGVKRFADSFDSLLAAIETKRAVLAAV
ncbi:MAG TPA: transaldolase [Gemmatimonadales bacterium]|nr:transaldolase [Gemmatimonadales bacterium]